MNDHIQIDARQHCEIYAPPPPIVIHLPATQESSSSDSLTPGHDLCFLAGIALIPVFNLVVFVIAAAMHAPFQYVALAMVIGTLGIILGLMILKARRSDISPAMNKCVDALASVCPKSGDPKTLPEEPVVSTS